MQLEIIEVDWRCKVKDSFTILNNNDGIGDNRNILKMIDYNKPM